LPLRTWSTPITRSPRGNFAGIEDASAHSLRHTFATQHVKRGTELPVVQAALGHENLATTSRYVGLVREQMDQRLQENAL
jgi:site-specific recombinase XerD